MRKYYFKLSILILALSLSLTGLIIFEPFYFSNLCNLTQFSGNYSRDLEIIKTNNFSVNEQQGNIHLSNPNEAELFEAAFKFSKQKMNLSANDVVGGIIPHHLLASDLIAEFFYNLKDKDYDTIILIGPNHFSSGTSDIIISAYNWQTPYGILECDKDISEEMLRLDEVKIDEDAIKEEHSVSSEVSFIKKVFSQSKFLPIILKPNVDEKKAGKLAEQLFKITQDKKVLVLASVDFSHYKNSAMAQNNDRISIKAIENFSFGEIYNLDIDSPASIYFLLKFSQLNGSEFKLLNNSNSAILADKPNLESTTSYVTGYFIK